MNAPNSIGSDFYTAKELLKYGYTFDELLSLSDPANPIIRRSRRFNYKGDEVYTFSESDLIKYREANEVIDNGN